MSELSNERNSDWLTALDHARELTLDQLLRRIIQIATELFSADAGGIYLLDENEQKLKLILRSGDETALLEHTVSLGEGLAGRVAESQRPLTVTNYDAWVGRSLIVDRHAPESFIGIPLTTTTKTLGVLYLSSTGRNFTNSDTHFLTSWSIFVTIVLTSAARLEYVRKTLTTQEGLIDQLPRSEWHRFVEGFLRGMREEIQEPGTAAEMEDERAETGEKLAAIKRLRGSIKSEIPPTDEEVKEDYANYLMKKYS
jgi:signal transduction protein with GAF and PtsI domain